MADAAEKLSSEHNQSSNIYSNGHVPQDGPIPRRRTMFQALVQDFSPVWFTWSMNTGILSLLMHTLPYQFDGLLIISTVLYVVDLIIFIICCTLMALRFIIHKKKAWDEITSDVQELCFMACIPIAWMTLTSLTALIVSNASWGSPGFTIVAYVMWWIAVVWTLTFFFAVYIILTKQEMTQARSLSLAIILPAVATSTTAIEGGLISAYSADISAKLAVPVIITSFMLLGIGVFVAVLIYALFLERILVDGWFDGVRRPSLVILVGPTGQSAAALMVLSTAATMHFENYGKGIFLTAQAAQSLHGACVLFALMLFGLGIFWMFYAVYGIMDAVIRGQAKWTPAWYSTIFPAGTMCSALILFSEQMDSPTFRVLATGLLIILTINVIVNSTIEEVDEVGQQAIEKAETLEQHKENHAAVHSVDAGYAIAKLIAKRATHDAKLQKIPLAISESRSTADQLDTFRRYWEELSTSAKLSEANRLMEEEAKSWTIDEIMEIRKLPKKIRSLLVNA